MNGRIKHYLPGHTWLGDVVKTVEDCPDCVNPPPPVRLASQAGHGACSCGLVSDHQGSQTGRRAWHFAHKQDIREEVINALLQSRY